MFAVPGLSVACGDDEHGDAVDLFAAGSAAGGSRGVVTTTTSTTVRTICQRLDGMALAIELAAARVASFGVDGVDRALDGRPRVARRRPRHRRRHGSLRAAIDWSYDLLDDDEQACCASSACSPHRSTLDAARVVHRGAADELLDVLGRLVDWNLSACGRVADPLPGARDDPPVRRPSDPSNWVKTSQFETHTSSGSAVR